MERIERLLFRCVKVFGLLCFRSPDEDMVHHSFSMLIREQSEDLTNRSNDIEMYPLDQEETTGAQTYSHVLHI